MKVFGFNIGGNSAPQAPSQEPKNDKVFQFTSPFLKVGDGNLSMPYISPQYTGVGGYVRFGQDNLFPNLLRQLTHAAPLVGSIVNFQRNATVGGGYEFINMPENGPSRVELYKFENIIGLQKLLKRITKDAIVYESVNFLVKNDANGKAKTLKRIPQDELRWDEAKCLYTYCKDFSRNIGVKNYEKYKINTPNHEGILTFRFDDDDSIYPIPRWASSNNWAFLSNEESYLQKSNIQNSIFPSTVFKFPKKPQSDEEWAQYKKTLESAKGAASAGRSIAFFENGIDQLPIVESFATSNNDKLFMQTSTRMDMVICQSFTIDPILMGIRVSGALGNGSDIKQAYTIWEKNIIMPLRNDIEDMMNMLMDLFQIQGTFQIKNYQIIENEIVEDENAASNKVSTALNAMSPLVATKILSSMTPNEVRALAGLKPVPGGDILPSDAAKPEM